MAGSLEWICSISASGVKLAAVSVRALQNRLMLRRFTDHPLAVNGTPLRQHLGSAFGFGNTMLVARSAVSCATVPHFHALCPLSRGSDTIRALHTAW